jgi:hypothetical protein
MYLESQRQMKKIGQYLAELVQVMHDSITKVGTDTSVPLSEPVLAAIGQVP